MEFDGELKSFESNELAGYLNPAEATLQPEFPCRLNQLYIESVISYKNSLSKIKTTNLIPSFNYFIKNHDQNNDKNANDLKGNEINFTKNVIIDLKNNLESNASSNANRIIIHPVSSKYKYRRDRFKSEPNLISNRNKASTSSTKQSQKSSTYSILPRGLFKQFSFCNKPQHSSIEAEKTNKHKYISKSLDNIMKNEKKSYKKRSRSTSKTRNVSDIKQVESRTVRKSIILSTFNILANSTEALSLLDQKSGSCSSVSANSFNSARNDLPKSNSCSSLVILKENFKNKEVLDQRMIQDHNEILNLTKKEAKPNTNGTRSAFKTFNIKKAISNLYRSRSRAVSNGKDAKKKKTNASAGSRSDTHTPKHSITSKKSLINMYFFKKSSQSSTKSNSLANIGFFSNSRRSTSSTSARFNANSIDLRSYSEKRGELNDIVLNLFINSEKCAHRRNAVCTKIDKLYYDRQLVNYMEYLLREDYIKNFLL